MILDNGKILTFVVEQSKTELTNDKSSFQKNFKLTYSEELSVFEEKVDSSDSTIKSPQINNIKLFKTANYSTKAYFVLTTNTRVLAIPNAYCKLKLDKQKCNDKLFPYCVWSSRQNSCVESYLFEISDTIISNQSQGLNSSLRQISIENGIKQEKSTDFDVIKIPAYSLGSFYQFDSNKIIFSFSLNAFFVFFIMVSAIFCIFLVLAIHIVFKKFLKHAKKNESALLKLKLIAQKYIVMFISLFSMSSGRSETDKSTNSTHTTACSISSTESEVIASLSNSPTASSSSSTSAAKFSALSVLNSQTTDPNSRYVFLNKSTSSSANLNFSLSKSLQNSVLFNSQDQISGQTNFNETKNVRFKDYDSAEYGLRSPRNSVINDYVHQQFRHKQQTFASNFANNELKREKSLNPGPLIDCYKNGFYL